MSDQPNEENLPYTFSQAVEVAAHCRRWLLVSLYDDAWSNDDARMPSPCWPRKEFWQDPSVSVAIERAFLCYTLEPTPQAIDLYESFFSTKIQLPHLVMINPATMTREVLYQGNVNNDGLPPPLTPQDFVRRVLTQCDQFVHQLPSNPTELPAFKPPNHLSHRVTNFSQLLQKCKTAQRWLIVNVQDDNLPSLTLNSEVWRHPVIESLILEGFLFWQTCQEFHGASWYMQRYNVKALPHVAILDAQSGETVWQKEGWTWEKRLTVEHFAEVIVSLDKRKSARHRSGDSIASVVAKAAALSVAAGSVTSEAGVASWECLSLCDAWEKLSMGEAGSVGSVDDLEGWEILDSPTHLLHNAETFVEVMNDARDAGRRLIVNIQDDGPSSRALNLDIWRDSRVENLIMEGFYMWQQSSDSKEAKDYCTRFQVNKYPHTAILDGDQILWRMDGWDWTVDEPWTANMFVDKLKEHRQSL